MQIDYDNWRKPKPQGVSACIRVRNEAQFMERAVMSVIDMVDEVVLCTQPSDDDTLYIAAMLSHNNDKVKVHHYPAIPAWIDTPEFYAGDPDEYGHLVHMSNYALSKCSYSWILKIEGDVIALPYLADMLATVRTQTTPVYYGIVILNVAGENMDKISLENPRNGGWDEAIFPNNPDVCKFHRSNKWEVAIPQCPRVSLGWGLLHMKRCKEGKTDGWNGEQYIEWTQENVERALGWYNANSPYPAIDNMPLGFPVEIGKACVS